MIFLKNQKYTFQNYTQPHPASLHVIIRFLQKERAFGFRFRAYRCNKREWYML